MKTRTEPWEKVILGQPYSKANSRRLVTIKGKPAMIKSRDALLYCDGFRLQCRQLQPMFRKDVAVEATIFYQSRRSDLDESLILDLLQGRVYENDRQVRRKIINWGLDKDNPRVELKVYPL